LNRDFRIKLFKEWVNNPNKNTLIMGILNMTPDSFSDGGKFNSLEKAIKHTSDLIRDGADIIDIGGESSRPGALPISVEEELNRVLPIISLLRKEFPKILISIDTYKSEVAKKAIDSGADIVNDITAMKNDPKMPQLIYEYKIPIILMHMRGTPENMQSDINYKDIIDDIIIFFRKAIKYAKSYKIKNEQIILDPGIGFGKTLEQNFILLKNIKSFCKIGYPILIGTSRKSFLSNILKVGTDNLLEGTIASSLYAVFNGARILRVHDVREVKKAVIIIEKAMNFK